jgi:hypothetical protein
MSLRLVLRPYLWETRADAAAQTVSVRADSPEAPWERTFTLAELRDPAAVLRSLGQPAALAWLTPWLAAGQGQAPKLDLRLDWDTRVDWSHLGRTRVRVYRVQARLLDKYRIDVMASRVGEILRVDLPYDIRLVNEAIAGLPEGIPAR